MLISHQAPLHVDETRHNKHFNHSFQNHHVRFDMTEEQVLALATRVVAASIVRMEYLSSYVKMTKLQTDAVD